MKLLLIFGFTLCVSLVKVQCGYELFKLPCDSAASCEEKIKAALESTRQVLKLGFPELGIPSFDPLELDPIDREFNDEMVKGNLSLTKTTIQGIADFIVTNVEVNINLPTTISLGLNFTIGVDTGYEGNLQILNMLNLFGKGDVGLLFTNLSLETTLHISLPLQISQLDLYITLPTSEAKITGLFNDERLSDIVSRQLSDTLTTLATEEVDRVNAIIYDVAWYIIEHIINRVLANQKEEVDANDIANIIMQHPRLEEFLKHYNFKQSNIV